MATGAHTMSEINCGGCNTYLGWRIVRAHEPTERWKEGHFLLELEHLYAQADYIAPLNLRPRARTSFGSDTTNSDS
jgi:Yippee zinc-binding/DNA-binding /Mis18, centromere assembly